MSDKTYPVEFTAGELDTLIDAVRVYESEADVPQDHPILAELTSIREKLAAAYKKAQ